jgi:hypothetical protein
MASIDSKKASTASTSERVTICVLLLHGEYRVPVLGPIAVHLATRGQQ